jgi:acetolactate synthase-1/2/3 large subunit
MRPFFYPEERLIFYLEVLVKLSGAEFIIEALKKEGVTTVFGYPGGSVIPIFDALYAESDVHVVLTRHEQAAVHAADGYARSTGKTGVCIVTSGPGATNTITGLGTANFDSVPLVCIAGQVPRNMIGNDAFQEADTVGITRPVTKHNYLVMEREDLPRVLKSAFFIAGTGRPGPVVVDVPKDILLTAHDDVYPARIKIRGYNPVYNGHAGQIKRAAAVIAEAKKPLFFIGGGMHISGAASVFRQIVEKTGIPVVTSLMGLGILPNADPRFIGMIGMHGTFAANMAVSCCDLLVGIGVRFDDRATGDLSRFAPGARIVHIDIDPSAIARNVKVEVPIVGDARTILKELLPLLDSGDRSRWLSQIREWDQEHPVFNPNVAAQEPGITSPEEVFSAVNEEFPDVILATDVGQSQMWAALFYHFCEPRRWLTSGGLGTMGYGFPAAIGAQIAHRGGRRVVLIAGDGSIQMNIQELATAVLEEVPVIVVIMNNGYLGMVRQWQELFCDRRYSSTCLHRNASCPPGCTAPDGQCPPYVPDFIKLAEAYGAKGIRACGVREIRAAFRQAMENTKGPTFIEIPIQREANVWPIVPPGGGLTDMILEPASRGGAK